MRYVQLSMPKIKKTKHKYSTKPHNYLLVVYHMDVIKHATYQLCKYFVL